MSRVMQMPPPPPLLLTKRVTSFLRANLSPHMHSAMLTTPAGSLLAHASNLPATALRRQAAVAASLWALQGPSNTSPNPEPSAASISGSSVRTRKSGKHSQPTVTVQLDSGAIFAIRRLRCGMLFICMGGAELPAGGRLTPTPPAPHITRLSRSPAPIIRTPPAPDHPVDTNPPTTDQHTGSSTTAPPPSTPPGQIPSIATSMMNPPTTTNTSTPTTVPTSPAPHLQNSPSQASILSTGAASTTSTTTLSSNSNVSLMRRQVEELARWLDERLGGLCVPEEGIGISGPSHGVAVGNGNGNRGGNGNGLAVR